MDSDLYKTEAYQSKQKNFRVKNMICETTSCLSNWWRSWYRFESDSDYIESDQASEKEKIRGKYALFCKIIHLWNSSVQISKCPKSIFSSNFSFSDAWSEFYVVRILSKSLKLFISLKRQLVVSHHHVFWLWNFFCSALYASVLYNLNPFIQGLVTKLMPAYSHLQLIINKFTISIFRRTTLSIVHYCPVSKLSKLP